MMKEIHEFLFKPKLYELHVWHNNAYHPVFGVNKREIIQVFIMVQYLRYKKIIGKCKFEILTFHDGHNDKLYRRYMEKYEYLKFKDIWKMLKRKLAKIVKECEVESQ